MKKSVFYLVAVLLFSMPVFSQGKHKGEVNQLDVDISFYAISGQTTTDASGIRYCNAAGRCSYENKVYPPEYWGTYPLFYFGRLTGITVKITNKGPRNVAKVLITTEAYVLKTDGSSGTPLIQPRYIEVEVEKGETKIIDASFTPQYTPGMDSGLDRFLVKVSHLNQGGGKGNPEPGLIMVKEGVFCPPEPL